MTHDCDLIHVKQMSTGIYDKKKAITIHTLLLVNNCIQNSGGAGKNK